MRAAFIDKVESIVFTDVEEPQISKESDVKIRVKVAGICGSEVHAFHGTHLYRVPPVVSGHEFSGDVVEVGKGVTKFKVGDRVTVEPHYGCGQCDLCKTGRYNICKSKVVLGSNDWSGPFGEYVVVPEETVLSIPDAMSYEEAAMIEPLAVGLHLVKRSGIKKGQTIAIIGAGTIGLGILISAKRAGAKNIIVSDMLDYNLGIAEQLGADYCINSGKENAAEKFEEYSKDTGIDIVFLAVEARAAFQTALKIVSNQGTLAVAVVPHDAGDLMSIIHKELTIIGTLMYVRAEFESIRDGIADGSIDVKPFISRVFPVEEAKAAMELADEKKEDVIKVMLSFD